MENSPEGTDGSEPIKVRPRTSGSEVCRQLNDARETSARPSMTLAEAAAVARGRASYSSGSKAIDLLLGGGFRAGEMVEAFGASNTGKTQLAMQATLAVAARGATSVFIDTEGTFRPERLAAMAEARGMRSEAVLELVYCIRAENTNQQFDAIDHLRRTERVARARMLVVDTITKNFALEYGGSRLTARRQTLLGLYLNILARDAYAHDRAVLLTNRVASVGPQAAAREVDIGGTTLRRYVTKAIRLHRKGGLVLASLEGSALRSEATITAIGLE